MVTEKDKGGCAFPNDGSWANNNPEPGMFLRDWFAGQALIGIVTAHGIREASFSARDAYKMADAMIAERAK